jgi:enterochelin esterase-like enzyme
MARFGLRRWLVGVCALGWLVVGLLGAYSYGEAYYVHRGFTPLAQLPRSGTGRLVSVHFYSASLHRNSFYLAYLPPGYQPSHRYPVLYLLHGMPGRPQVFIDIANMDVRLDNLLSQGRVRPMILVFPDGRIGGSAYSDSEWANTPSGDYESSVLDVVRDVDRRFATLPDRQDRVIGGFSAGAYGAINIALHHVPEFGSVEVWSGYFSETRRGVFAHADQAALEHNSPIDYAATRRAELAVDPLRVFMFVGRDDEASRQIVPMAKALRANGASVRYAIYAGGHDWQVWYPRLNQMLILASHDVSQRSPADGLAAASLNGAIAAPRHRPAAHDRRRSGSGSGERRRRAARHRRRGARHRRRRGAGERGRGPRRDGPLVAGHHRRTVRRRRRLIGALLLALVSAAAINLGFMLQHRGHAAHPAGARRPLAAALRSRWWLAGQALGWVGFAGQIIAVAIAPLSLVQAFAAGGLAISVPLAAGLFRYRVSRRQLLAVLVIAASLASLPLALSPAHGHLHTDALIRSAVIALLAAAALALTGRPSLRAIAAGVFYGVADAAIKAVSVAWRLHGSVALFSGWTALAVVATLGGFVAFQAALRAESAVSAISLMSAFAALVALACGVYAFGESLGRTSAAIAVHLVAISLVLVCVPGLAGAQQQIANAGASLGEDDAPAGPLQLGYGTG